MQSVSSRIWTRVAVSISYDENHYTTGTPNYTKVRLLSEEKYNAVKLLKAGIIRPLKSAWSSPLHLVQNRLQETGECVVTLDISIS